MLSKIFVHMAVITRELIDQAMTYIAYRQLVQNHVTQGTSTAPQHSEAMSEYTRLNEARMRRLDKTARLDPQLLDRVQAIELGQMWLVITESWCGDAAQIIPVLEHLAQANPHIDLRLILRDEHPQVMDRFLTNGARSIPIVIVLDADTLDVLGQWGPRPAPAQDIAMETKKIMQDTHPSDRGRVYQERAIELQRWYVKDKSATLQAEFERFLRQLSS